MVFTVSKERGNSAILKILSEMSDKLNVVDLVCRTIHFDHRFAGTISSREEWANLKISLIGFGETLECFTDGPRLNGMSGVALFFQVQI